MQFAAKRDPQSERGGGQKRKHKVTKAVFTRGGEGSS